MDIEETTSGIKKGGCRSAKLVLSATVLALLLCIFMSGGSVAEIGHFFLEHTDREPDEVIKLSDLEIEVDIEGGFAKVRLRQTFQNLTAHLIEGSYYLRLPANATVMDFGMWEDGKWLDSAIVSKERASRAYNQLVNRKIDPALMESADAELTDALKISVAPIPPFSTRRVETVYHHWLKVSEGERRFLLPLAQAKAEAPEKADHCRIIVKVSDNLPLGDISLEGPKGAAFQIERQKEEKGRSAWKAVYEGGPLKLSRDLSLHVPMKISESRLSLFTYRDVDTEALDISATGGGVYRDKDGYFLAEAVYNLSPNTGNTAEARDVVLLVDTSLSMQLDKLRQAARIVEEVLAGLDENDGFTILTMDKEVSFWRRTCNKADAENKSKAIDFLYETPLTSGTDISNGFRKALRLAKDGERGKPQVVAVTDGQATLGEIRHKELIESVLSENEDPPVPVHIFGVGEDTNVPFLKKISNESGAYFTWALQSEDIKFKLSSFLKAVADVPLRDVTLSMALGKGVKQVYPAVELVGFNHESLNWVGKYSGPATSVTASVVGKRADKEIKLTEESALPEKSTDHGFVRRLWAERRVDHLIELIRLEGEEKKWIEEIVYLSRKFKFPTPYTSYLVAPRVMMEPSLMRSMDPVLRVTADPGTRSVVALFPFGEVKELRYIDSEDVWETRFLVPEWMDDGRYWCRLIITGEKSEKRMEQKRFTVDNTPPSLDVRAKGPVRPGEAVELYVDAPPDTRWIRARLGRLPPVDVRWDPSDKINRGRVLVPPSTPPGEYVIRFTAEDFARNNAGAQTTVRVGG